MNVSALEEYGLRCAVRLAGLKEGETLSAPEIAEMEGLSVEYVSKFMLHLKKAELVRTVRGMKGGFALTKTASEISLKEVFEALRGKRQSQFGEETEAEFCNNYSGKATTCVRLEGCTIRPFWKIMAKYIDEFTRELSLQDLLKSEEETSAKTEIIARKNMEQLKQQLEEEVRA